MSPTAIFSPLYPALQYAHDGGVPGCGEEVYPGWGIPGWVLGGLYRYSPIPVPGPIFNHILSLRPYPRPNEGHFKVIDEVSEIGSRISLRMTSFDLRIDPPGPLPDHPQTGPEMALRWSPDGPQELYTVNKALFSVLLTVAEVLGMPSKDWIRPPSRCQK